MSEGKSARELVGEIRNALELWGANRAAAVEGEAAAMREIAEWARQGEGILSVSEMAKLSGVSRDTIYKMLEEGE